MRKGFAAALAAQFAVTTVVWAAPVCEQPQDSLAIRVAAVQQEMMVAAFNCQTADGYNQYNSFVLAHQPELLQADHVLLAFFKTVNTSNVMPKKRSERKRAEIAAQKKGADDYNLYKTELANAASLRALHDPHFCNEVTANFLATQNRSVEQFLAELPYQVDTGSVQCPWPSPAPAAARPDEYPTSAALVPPASAPPAPAAELTQATSVPAPAPAPVAAQDVAAAPVPATVATQAVDVAPHPAPPSAEVAAAPAAEPAADSDAAPVASHKELSGH